MEASRYIKVDAYKSRYNVSLQTIQVTYSKLKSFIKKTGGLLAIWIFETLSIRKTSYNFDRLMIPPRFRINVQLDTPSGRVGLWGAGIMDRDSIMAARDRRHDHVL